MACRGYAADEKLAIAVGRALPTLFDFHRFPAESIRVIEEAVRAVIRRGAGGGRLEPPEHPRRAVPEGRAAGGPRGIDSPVVIEPATVVDLLGLRRSPRRASGIGPAGPASRSA